MRDTLKNEPNTIWKSFKFMNTMMRDATKMGGIVDKNPFETFEWLLQADHAHLPDQNRARQAWGTLLIGQALPRELYKVGCIRAIHVLRGLRFEDTMRFDYDIHVIDDERMVMETQKAKAQVNIRLFPKLREVPAYTSLSLVVVYGHTRCALQ